MSSLVRLQTQIGRLRALASAPEERLYAAAPQISGWSVAEHVDHLVKVSSAVVGRVREENAPPEPRGISFIGRVILACGWIPRGVGKSPARVHGARATPVELEASLQKLEKSVAAVAPSMIDRRTPIVPHPRFGGLTPAQALRFAVVHNEHHLKIVEEILRSSARKNVSVGTSRPSL